MKSVFGIVVFVSSLGLAASDDDDKNRPVSKVISLLKEMQAQLASEHDEDEEVYDKMSCWCQTNDREKTKSIADAQARIQALTAQIAEASATAARLSAEIDATEKEVAANQAALDKAAAIRKEELAAFTEEEKDMIQSVQALKAAITVLSKHHSSMLQVPRSHLLGVVATLQHEMQKHASLLQGVLSPSQRRMVASFARDQDTAFLQSKAQPYAAQSGQIFGILQQMLETFQNNLSQAQKEEIVAQKAFEELKIAKEAEISAGQAQIDAKSTELAAADEQMAQAKQDKKDTAAQLSADEEFLIMLKDKCKMTNDEWDQRQKTRAMELEAVSKALELLSTDEAHDLMTRTFNPSFLQLHLIANRQAEASAVLSTLAHKMNNPALAALAMEARLRPFTKVKEAIDKMIENLLTEKADEIKKKDMCTNELNGNQLQTEEKVRQRTDLEAAIASHKSNVETLSAAIATLQSEIAEMQKQVKTYGEDREKANQEFQKVLNDQRATQRLLSGAIRFLKDYYEKKADRTAFVQAKKQGPAPPEGFKQYEDNSHSGGVIGLLESIVQDTKDMETETVRAEEDEQKAYEGFVKETNAGIDKRSASSLAKSGHKADEEAALVEAKQNHDNVALELSMLSNQLADLHNDCDFVLKNFDVRQTARDEEVEALRQAKAILSGAGFEKMVGGR